MRLQEQTLCILAINNSKKFYPSNTLILSENMDYAAVSESVVFAANSPVGSQQCFTLTIINDVRKEEDETFTLTASVSDPNCPSPGDVVVTILNADSKTLSTDICAFALYSASILVHIH